MLILSIIIVMSRPPHLEGMRYNATLLQKIDKKRSMSYRVTTGNSSRMSFPVIEYSTAQGVVLLTAEGHAARKGHEIGAAVIFQAPCEPMA
jgi:hypothetical protein